jgi:uncharacterized cysteine cluster protein YcgN (CxxCxxCC family)
MATESKFFFEDNILKIERVGLFASSHLLRLCKRRRDMIGVMKTIDRDHWEDICTKCGKCCYEKLDLGGGLIQYTDEPCAHLDTETNLCKVYERRHEVQPDCISLTADLVRYIHWLPEDCAYVEYVRHRDTLVAVRDAEKARRRHGISQRRKRNGHKNLERQ